MKRLLFILIFILFIFGNVYFYYSISPLTVLFSQGIRIFIYGLQVLMPSAFLLFFFFSKHLPVYIAAMLYKIGAGWLILVIYAFIGTIIVDILAFINLYFLDNAVVWLRFYSVERSFLLILFVILIAIYGYLNYRHTRRVVLFLKSEKKIEKSFKIVFISDVHLGYAIGKNELKKWIKLINSEQADLVLIGGDLVDISVQPLDYFSLDGILNKIESSNGSFACLGNHEYLAGVQKSRRFIESTGIKVLCDESVFLKELNVTLIGRDDLTNTKREPLNKLVDEIDKSSFIINIDHQPYTLEQSQNNAIDLQLSGHTHRGQVWPISLITDNIFECAHGYLKKGNTQYYISSGVGIWGGRYRIGTQSEYVVINVESKL